MKVFQLIYTKVAPEESPWRKADFHTVFYPINLMTKTDVLELEKRIHFPGSEKFKEKETVFYQKIKDKDYLVILHIRNLPEERDTFGRGGIFLCHGFIFPPELWLGVPSPLTLFEQVKEYLFTSRREILSSPLVDKEKGDIQPIEIPEERLKDLQKTLPALETGFEWEMVILLNRLSRCIEKRPAILFMGEAEETSALMNKLIAYVPSKLKTRLGWDSCFDGGALTFYPLKIVGFKYERPRGGGDTLEINLATQTIQKTTDYSELFLPQTPYERWLNSCSSEAYSCEQIDKAYNLSLLIEEETTSFDNVEVLAQRRCFASANREKIKDVFLKRCGMAVGTSIASHIACILTPEAMLDLIIENLPLAKLAGYAEDVILKNKLRLEAIKTPLPNSLIKAGSSRLRLIEKLWRKEAIEVDELRVLEKEDKYEFVSYLLLTDWAGKEWVLRILREDEDMFNYLLSIYETRVIIEKILFNLILERKNFKGIEEFMLKEILRQEKGFSLLRKEMDMMEVLEESLKKGGLDDIVMKRIVLWAKKGRPLEKRFLYIRSFLYPEEGISEEILKDECMRERLLNCLIQYHNYRVKDLERFGFNKEELLRFKDKDWLERVKSFLVKIRR